MELQNKGNFVVEINSYFEGESKQNVKLKKNILEDDILSMIRINPKDLPTGRHNVIPSFCSLRTKHQTLKAVSADLQMKSRGSGISEYSIVYPELQSEVIIQFESKFPYSLLSWTETNQRVGLITTAKRIKSIKTDYWNKHNNVHLPLRKELGLE